jgi:hypothetical protein
VSVEFASEAIHHDILLDLTPILPLGIAFVTAVSEGVLRGECLDYQLLMRIPLVFFALEVVLVGFVMDFVESKRRMIKIAEKTVATICGAIFNYLVLTHQMRVYRFSIHFTR